MLKKRSVLGFEGIFGISVRQALTFSYRYYIATLLAVLLLPLMAPAQDPHAEVSPKPLEVQGDSVRFTVTITMPKDRVFKHDGKYIIRPELGDIQFAPIEIPSSQLSDAPGNGFTIEVTASALFDEDMIGNDLEIVHKYSYKDGRKGKEFNDMDGLAECCITTGTLFSIKGQYELKQFDYTPALSAPLKVVAQIDFPVDIATFPVNEHQGKVVVIGNYLKAHPEATITIRGFASPEGPVERNRELSIERTEVAKEWLTRALKKEGYGKYLSNTNINVETTAEDWFGFVQGVRNSGLEQEKKTRILHAVSARESLEKLEDDLNKIVGDPEVVEEYMRPLRRATIIASAENAFREGYMVEQIDSVNTMVKKGDMPVSALQDAFTQEEYLQAYVRNDAETGRLTLLTAYTKVYPSDMRVYSDLGALTAVDLDKIDVVGGDDAIVGVGFSRDLVDIDGELDLNNDKFKFKYKAKEEDVEDPEKLKLKIKAKLDETEGYFVKAYEAEPTDPVLLNNLGAFYISTGKFDEAKEYLDQAAEIRESEGVHYNLGVYHARMGDFELALKYFEKAGDVEGIEYNRGIARLLTGDVVGGLEDLQKFEQANPEHGITHYLVAVAAARANDEWLMHENLKEAIDKEARLADIAEEDLEFRMYWGDDTFEDMTDDH
ncbi:hypothetical protein C900_05880 [Fulvivirga imtechensis AK7]|uniref:Tetratricopeptide repeat protein n=1 Tax=Fulvivirga imtechensis AK7 TaxID=1237149 RepID=L8JMT8_9BACT|nr:hypothetical protein C900_05880 [Fulvivirga imtechensis AK7]